MLTIGRLRAGPEAGRYYERAVASGREDYYAGEGERPGRWVGSGSVGLGLIGEVHEGEVLRLLAAEHPTKGELLGRPLTEGSVAGFDLTFKAPKSVSILFGIGDPDLAAQLAAGHDAAVEEAIGYLEGEACRARRGKHGLTQVPGNGFVAARFQHRSSRAGDPLLHDHVVVANRTQGPDGRYTALDARPLHHQLKTAGYFYQAVLRRELSERLGVEWGPVRKGSAELVGISREVIKHFSQRRDEIVREMAAHHGHGLYAAQAAALATRKGKDYGVPADRLRHEWRARAAEFGLDRKLVESLLHPTELRPERQPDEVDVQALTRKASMFTRRDVLQAFAAAHPDGARVAELEAEADALLATTEVVRLEPNALGEPRYTTRELLELERSLLNTPGERRGTLTGIARPEAVEAAIAARPLSDEQAELVRALAQDGDGVAVVRAAAGTGKTFALDAARDAWEQSNVHVVGCALSARAAAELREQAGIDATTIARLERELVRGNELRYGGVLIVDEAGMVGTRDLAFLSEAAQRRGVKLVLVGDDKQLPEIEAGGAFRALAKELPKHELTEVRRQRAEWDREALNDLREGKVERWAEAYQREGRLVMGDNAPAVREQIVRDWWDARGQGKDALMIALRTKDVDDLNRRAREHMRDACRLHGEDVELGSRSFAIGDEIVCRKNDRHLGVINGDRATVTDVAETHVALRHRDGRETRLPAGYASDGHLDHGYAITAHRAQGATVDEAFVLGSDESYREWGYTALSRHRDNSRFYLTAPRAFLNHLDPPELDADQVKEIVSRVFSDSRAQQLALDAYDRDARIAGTIRRLGNAERRADEHERQAVDLEGERDTTPWFKRSQRDGLANQSDRAHRGVEAARKEAAELADKLRDELAEPPDRRPAKDPYDKSDLFPDLPGFEREPASDELLPAPDLPELEQLPDLSIPPPDHDLGSDMGW